MRILHWYPNFLTGGAVANALLGLVNAQARGGAEVFIASAEISGNPLYGSVIDHLRPEVKLIQWNPSWTFRQRGFVLRGVPSNIRKQLVRLKPDVVHIHGEFNPDNLRVPVLFQGPILLSPHGAFAPEMFTKSQRVLKSIYFLIARRFLYRHVKAFHALCPMEDGHINNLLPGVQVYRAPEGPNIRVEQSIPLEGQSGSRETIKFLFVGRLDIFTKGLDILLAAFAETESCLRRQPITLTLAGPDRKGSITWLQRRARELGIANRVFFTGSLLPHEVSAALHRSDIYIQLSRHEVFSLSVAEALLSRKPAILSKAVGVVSWPEVAGLPHVRVVPLDVKEAVATMIDFVHRLGELRTVAEQYQAEVGEFFSWERVARLHLKAYQNLCSSC